MQRTTSSSIAACVSLVIALTTPPPVAGQVVLAEVGGEQVTAGDLRIFTSSFPDGFAAGKSGFAADSLLLESLVDRTALAMEARSAGIADEPWFDDKIARFERQQVLTLYKSREINEKVEMSEEELLNRFRSSGRDRALRLAGILLDTEEEAAQVRSQIMAGADLAQLARERSVYEETRDRGGDLGRYLRKDKTSGFLEEAVFKLKPGEITRPLRFRYKGKWRYAILKILDEIPVPFGDVEGLVTEEVFTSKRIERQQALSDSLFSEYEPRVHKETLESVLRSGGADLSALAGQPLCTYRGGLLAVSDFLRFVPEGKRDPKRFKDADSFADFLLDVVMPSQLFIEEAHGAGLHTSPEIRMKVEIEKLATTLDTLRVRKVDRLVSVSDQQARSFYRDHPELFMSPEELVVNEVLVGSAQVARRIRERVEGGDSIEELANDFTLREEMAGHDGQLKISKYSRHRQLYEAAKGSAPGSLHGPVETGKGFSVFRVRDRKEATLIPLNESEYRRARAFVKIRKRQRAYVDFVRSLRVKYAVRVFHDQLTDM